MQFQLIRNATLRIEYAQQRFVIDPYLAPKHSMPSYADKSPNPLVELPISAQEVIDGIDMAVLSHLHSDHFDQAAKNILPSDLTIICQPIDVEELKNQVFQNATGVANELTWKSVNITRIDGRHGTGKVQQMMGEISGFVFQAENEPTVYWAGDTIWCEEVANAIDQYRPDIIITHSCGAVWGKNVLILMDAKQTVEVCKAAQNKTVVATHMDALDHATVSRKELREYAESKGILPEQLLIPEDGDILEFLV